MLSLARFHRTLTNSLSLCLSCCYVSVYTEGNARSFYRLFTVFDDIAFRLHYRYYACLFFSLACVLRRFG